MDNVKMANLLIEKGLVLDHIIYRYMKYSPAYKLKQFFKYYKYGHVEIFCLKNTRYGAYSGFYKTSECLWDREQKSFLYNGAFIS